MAAASYYSNLPAATDNTYTAYNPHHSGDIADHTRDSIPMRNSTPMKPLFLATQNQARYSGHYAPVDYELEKVQKEDEKQKNRIRTLRGVSRILATLLSLAALVPLILTLNKFLSTQHILRTVPLAGGGTITRSAWALKTKPWPTYMYLSVAGTSFVLNFATLIAYCCSVRAANIASTMSTVFTSLVLTMNITVWSVAAGIYKQQKEQTTAGKHDDLWGWTCSGPARAIQESFKDVVPFDTYCNIQSAGWYAGLVQVGAMVLSAVIYFLAWRRQKSKRTVRRSMDKSLVRDAGYN